MNRSDLERTIYSHIKDLSDNERSKAVTYKNIDMIFGDAVCNFVKKQFSYDEEKIQKYENTIKLMLDTCDIIQNATINTCAYDWIDVTGDITILESETLCSLMFTSTAVTGDKIIVSLLRGYRIAIIFAKIDHSPLGFRSKIMRALCPQYMTYYYKNYISVEDDCIVAKELKTDEFRDLFHMPELTYAKFIYLWGKLYKHITKKDFSEYKYHIDAEP